MQSMTEGLYVNVSSKFSLEIFSEYGASHPLRPLRGQLPLHRGASGGEYRPVISTTFCDEPIILPVCTKGAAPKRTCARMQSLRLYMLLPVVPRVDGVAQRVAHQIDRNHQYDDHQTRRHPHPRLVREDGDRLRAV